jgi:hypothetical protein
MTWFLFVAKRASLKAASMVSVPELVRNTFFGDLPGAIRLNLSASSAMGS